MTDTRDRLITLATAILEADKGHRRMYEHLMDLIPILREDEPLVVEGLEFLCDAMAVRCKALLDVTTEICKAEAL